MYAIRNIRLCTKDCLCLYICPTGATDTETGQIDASKCTGCGACAEACTSHAISMMPVSFPPQQSKTEGAMAALGAIAESKSRQEQAARQIAEEAESTKKPSLALFARALEMSNRLMAEDAMREAGFMLPQSANTRALLQQLLNSGEDGFPTEAAEKLLQAIEPNE